jgi:hypothetical protein
MEKQNDKGLTTVLVVIERHFRNLPKRAGIQRQAARAAAPTRVRARAARIGVKAATGVQAA